MVLHRMDKTDCNNRGSSLVTHSGKAFVNIVASRVIRYFEVEILLAEEYCGFRRSRSAVGTLFVVRWLQDL